MSVTLGMILVFVVGIFLGEKLGEKLLQIKIAKAMKVINDAAKKKLEETQ
jgi:hypothetical protein